MKTRKTELPGVMVLTAPIYRDSRGAFCETFNLRKIEEAGLPAMWVQDNFSVSSKNVLRGIHYQITQPQGKLVRVTHGRCSTWPWICGKVRPHLANTSPLN